ncbi:hypothetical protein DdX_07137 [Ditylenchus destructor]|uniref:Uncharacterized protein n=1 Tax=Ditylenchus destructor TaxID=166010 RepID=A0AAD4R8N5_9BILA|nr:hypothetical protein DdX_07137 [Ditylenchus destructor]
MRKERLYGHFTVIPNDIFIVIEQNWNVELRINSGLFCCKTAEDTRESQPKESESGQNEGKDQRMREDTSKWAAIAVSLNIEQALLEIASRFWIRQMVEKILLVDLK